MTGEIGMVDAISNGRMEAGFARAFLPHEFRTPGRSLDDDVGGFGVASLMSNAWPLPADKVEASMRLFSEEVMPRFKK
jgi:hypothetical protein